MLVYSTTFKGVFSHTVLHSHNALWVIQCCTVKPTLTRALSCYIFWTWFMVLETLY